MFQECVDCIDLDSTGRRWEGGINDGKPFGWGILYNEDGLKEYEGFLLDTSRICYGKEYYPDICQIRYDGCYMSNRRFGEGILYDRKGEVEYDGLWKNDEPYLPRIDGRLLTNRTEFFFITTFGFDRVESSYSPTQPNDTDKTRVYPVERTAIGANLQIQFDIAIKPTSENSGASKKHHSPI